MFRFWEPIVEPMLRAIKPATVVEIGCAGGNNTRNLAEFCRRTSATLHAIDPAPDFPVEPWEHEYGGHLVVHRGLSLNVLGRVDAPDVILIDGDHNWYTVFHELMLIDRKVRQADRPFPVVLLHDVCWPYGRRDLYYDPETVPAAYRKPYRRAGLEPGVAEPVETGGINAHLCNAIYEHDLQNGVLTALEDYLEASDRSLEFLTVPVLHGLGMLYPRDTATRCAEFGKLLDELRTPDSVTGLLEVVEQHRLEAEVRAANQTHRVSKLRGELERAREAARGELERAREEVRRTRQEVRGEVGRAKESARANEELARARQERIAELESELEALRTYAADREQHMLRQVADAKQDSGSLERERARQRARIQELEGRLEHELRERDAALQETRKDLRRARAAADERRAALARAEKAERDLERLRRRRSVRMALYAAQLARPLFRLARARGSSQTSPAPSPRAEPATLSSADPGRQKRETDTGVGVPGGAAELPFRTSADIVVCAHNALDDVRRCLEALLTHTSLVRHGLILVDDGSEAPTRDFLRDVAADASASLVRNEEARGYACAANQGLRASSRPYVVLLNSDTVVTPGWLDKLLACFASRPNAAVVGPLSNAASWQSIPRLTDDEGGWHTNELPPGTTPADLAARIERWSPALRPAVPLVNGFCYSISRKALDTVGLLDDQNFPQGYGEEDDFSIRCLDAGMSNYVADDCYVYHAKSRSYTPEGRLEIVQRSKQRLRDKHGRERIAELVEQMRTGEELVRARTFASIVVSGETMAEHSPPQFSDELLVGWLQPHLWEAGGIRRAIEMTNRLTRWGARVQLITPDGVRSDWLPVLADVVSVREAEDTAFDVLIGSDPDMVEEFEAIKAHQKIIYHLAPYALYRPVDEKLAKYYSPSGEVTHIANSTWTAQQVSDLAGIEVRAVLPGGVDKATFRPVARATTHDVVCFGSRREHKGTGAIERAASEFSVLKLEDTATEQGDLARLICSGRVFVSAAWHEGFNFCPLEAMACGVPVVMTDDGGSRDYARHSENALVVEVENWHALGQAIRKVLRDQELRSHLIEEGLRTAWRFDWDRVTSDFARLLI